jgi:hypothetical protein
VDELSPPLAEVVAVPLPLPSLSPLSSPAQADIRSAALAKRPMEICRRDMLCIEAP